MGIESVLTLNRPTPGSLCMVTSSGSVSWLDIRTTTSESHRRTVPGPSSKRGISSHKDS